ncbi:MAG: hypothetical protein AAFP70_17260 [Calditrichota bacterium]
MKLQFSMLLLIIAMLGCQPSAVKETTDTPETLTTDAGKPAMVQVRSENVRALPNGKRLGSLRMNSEITVLRRVGNWVQFTNDRFKEAYIWAPSVGYETLNLYGSDFYLDQKKDSFKSVKYFQNIFSQDGIRRQETSGSYELFFKDIGLGSHEVVVLDVVTESQQKVDHGITLFIDKPANEVRKVRVDYFKPVNGYQAALKKSELSVQEPSENNSGHIIWNAGTILQDISVDLERKEWDSKYFSSVWYILPDEE